MIDISEYKKNGFIVIENIITQKLIRQFIREIENIFQDVNVPLNISKEDRFSFLFKKLINTKNLSLNELLFELQKEDEKNYINYIFF
tara:strand:- start:333 stop:593 length:261 start_codon:yes stop_codon:yes gene_type:complete